MAAPDEQQQSLMRSLPTAENVAAGQDQEKTGRSLRESTPSWFWRIGIPALLLTVPLGYVALISCVLYLSNREQSRFGDGVLEVLQVASTIWPISFAAVMGPFLKTLALLGAEKGSSLASLEFLLTSQTTMAAFKNLVTIGHVRAWTVGVALAWCLSPLGGQAAVRSLSLRPNTVTQDMDAIYYLGGNVSNMNYFYQGSNADLSPFAGGSIQTTLMSDMRNAIAASFYHPAVLASHSNGSSIKFDDAVETLGGPQQAARLGQRDLWRNVRIPFMELLPGYDAREPESWMPVPADMVVPYASLIGIPIRGGTRSRAGNSTLLVQAHYQTLSCGDGFNGSTWLRNGSTKILYHNLSSTTPLRAQTQNLAVSGTKPNIFLDVVNDTAAVKDHLRLLGYPVAEPSSKLDLLVGGSCSIEQLTEYTVLRRCRVSTTYVDMNVSCTRLTALGDLNCHAERVRHSPGFPVSGNLTGLSSVRTMAGIVWEMPFTTASYHVSESSNLEMFLRDPPLLFKRFDNGHDVSRPGCFSEVPNDIFGARLATALNTFIMAMYNTSVLTGADGTSTALRSPMWQKTTAEWREFSPSVYVVHKAWFSSWLASTALLLVCAAAAVAVRCLVRAPDFLDSVAGLTRDSPFMRLPPGGSGVSGVERLQALKGVKVQICDVRPDADVGRIALTTRLDGSKLDWERAYS